MRLLILGTCLLLMACNSPKKTTTNISQKTSATPIVTDSLNKKLQAGIDFWADGNIPGKWALEMDMEKGFYFTPANGTRLIATPVPPSINPKGEVYAAKTDAGLMTISIFKSACGDNPQSNKRMVEVSVNNTHYVGCGKYLTNIELNGAWELDQIDNKYPNIANSHLPWFVFDILQKTVTGYDGCNNIAAQAIVEGNRIKFGPIRSTKKACPDIDASLKFVDQLSDHTIDYMFKGGNLVMILPNESTVTLRKRN